ncbi:hypothetical protein SAMN05421773_11515 [Streptomyces aidingensis]|uniref:PQQ-like domain-containing protein n=2 Tax=Streptomyces aidingensis TaxID=910347 RepID=A0A1I1SHS7_9ACTN|nr:hypothetical protein SAMN05421773_11515 [Streptomyces aidingensis]
MIANMTSPLHVDRILGDRPFAETGDPALVVADRERGMLAIAGRHRYGFISGAPVGVYGIGDQSCRALVRSHYPVHGMAFHPSQDLLAIGAGRYDGGYFFEGELLLLNLETGEVVSAFEERLGRQVLELEWLSGTELRLTMAPPDDWGDEQAHHEGHTATVTRRDWYLLAPRSLTHQELAGPRGPAPRRETNRTARRLVEELAPEWTPRHDVRTVEQLADGRCLAALDGVRLESWLPSGEREWAVADEEGGREIVVAADEQSAWVSVAASRDAGGYRTPRTLARISLVDGSELDRVVPSRPVSLLRSADGRPVLMPRGTNGVRSSLPVRRGRRIYFQEAEGPGRPGRQAPGKQWLAAAGLPEGGTGRPEEPVRRDAQRLFPFSWIPGETHFGGPAVETADGTLVHAGTVYDGRGLQPGGSFVVRRSLTDGAPRWVFRTDRQATALDTDPDTVYIAYDDGEIVALALADGSVSWRQYLTVGEVPAIPTALTITQPGRLLIGTSDGRILLCSTEH